MWLAESWVLLGLAALPALWWLARLAARRKPVAVASTMLWERVAAKLAQQRSEKRLLDPVTVLLLAGTALTVLAATGPSMMSGTVPPPPRPILIADNSTAGLLETPDGHSALGLSEISSVSEHRSVDTPGGMAFDPLTFSPDINARFDESVVDALTLGSRDLKSQRPLLIATPRKLDVEKYGAIRVSRGADPASLPVSAINIEGDWLFARVTKPDSEWEIAEERINAPWPVIATARAVGYDLLVPLPRRDVLDKNGDPLPPDPTARWDLEIRRKDARPDKDRFWLHGLKPVQTDTTGMPVELRRALNAAFNGSAVINTNPTPPPPPDNPEKRDSRFLHMEFEYGSYGVDEVRGLGTHFLRSEVVGVSVDPASALVRCLPAGWLQLENIKSVLVSDDPRDDPPERKPGGTGNDVIHEWSFPLSGPTKVLAAAVLANGASVPIIIAYPSDDHAQGMTRIMTSLSTFNERWFPLFVSGACEELTGRKLIGGAMYTADMRPASAYRSDADIAPARPLSTIYPATHGPAPGLYTDGVVNVIAPAPSEISTEDTLDAALEKLATMRRDYIAHAEQQLATPLHAIPGFLAMACFALAAILLTRRLRPA
jgi:hypothetical protein